MDGTPKSSRARYHSKGCHNHAKSKYQPLHFVEDEEGCRQQSTTASFTSNFEQGSLMSLLGDIDEGWFDEARWPVVEAPNHELDGKDDEIIQTNWNVLQTPKAVLGMARSCPTPGLFTPDALSPVTKVQVDGLHLDPPPFHLDHDPATTPVLTHTQRLRKYPSSMTMTPTSQVITSHQPTTSCPTEPPPGPAEPPYLSQQPPDLLAPGVPSSPYPAWNPTPHRNHDTPIFMKQLFKTPSTLYGKGERRACSTPLQSQTTPQRLSRSLVGDQEESDLSWTSSLATPPMSSKGGKTPTSSSAKKQRDESHSWESHDVAKVLFKEGTFQVEMERVDDEGDGSTQPLPAIKLPSITDESQEDDFTMETDDCVESETEVKCDDKAEMKEGNAEGNASCSETNLESRGNLCSERDNHSRKVPRISTPSLLPYTSTERGNIIDRISSEQGELNKFISKEHNAETVGESYLASEGSQLLCSPESSATKISSQCQNRMDPPHSGSHLGATQESTDLLSQTSCKSEGAQGNVRNQNSAVEDTLAFLLATPPGVRKKLLGDLSLTSEKRTGVHTSAEENLDNICKTDAAQLPHPEASQGSPKEEVISSGDNVLKTDGSVLEVLLATGTSKRRESSGYASISVCTTTPHAMQPEAHGHSARTPQRPIPEGDLLSPISPDFAEALCMVTDRASLENLGDVNKPAKHLKNLEVERDLIGSHDVSSSAITVLHTERSSNAKCSDVGAVIASIGTAQPSIGTKMSDIDQELPVKLSEANVCNSAGWKTSTPLRANQSVKSRFNYSANIPRCDDVKEGVREPSWLSRAIYVEEEEEQEAESGVPESKEELVAHRRPMRRPYRKEPSFTTFSTFTKMADKVSSPVEGGAQMHASPAARATPTAKATPTSRRPATTLSDPHVKVPIRTRETLNGWPLPKRLRLEEGKGNEQLEGGGGSSLVEKKSAADSEISSRQAVDPSDQILMHLPVSSECRDGFLIPNHVNQPQGQGECTDVDRKEFNNTRTDPIPNSALSLGHSSKGDHPDVGMSSCGFSSASGKAITVSSSALTRAEKLLKNIDKEELPKEFQLNMSGDAPCGFQSASGRTIPISDTALLKAKEILREVGPEDEETGMANSSKPCAVGFSSASGKDIKVSEAALAKAKKIIDTVCTDEPGPVGDADQRFQENSVQEGNISKGQSERNHKGRTGDRRLPKGYRPFKPPGLIQSRHKQSSSEVNISMAAADSSNLKEHIQGGQEISQNNGKLFEVVENQECMELNQSMALCTEQRSSASSREPPVLPARVNEHLDEDGLTATQAEREIKAAEEMELVYNFMQEEEDAGLSQLDISSLMAVPASVKATIQETNVQQQNNGISSTNPTKNVISTSICTEDISQTATDFPNYMDGATKTQETSGDRQVGSQISLDVAHVTSHVEQDDVAGGAMSNKREIGSCESASVQSQLTKSPQENDHSREHADGQFPERSKEEINQGGMNRGESQQYQETAATDISMNTVRQLLDDSSMIEELNDETNNSVSSRQGNATRNEPLPGIDEVPLSTAQEALALSAAMDTEESLSYDVRDGKVVIRSDLPSSKGLQQQIVNNVGSQRTLSQRSENGQMSSVGFQTASGRKVKIQQASLIRAKQMFSDELVGDNTSPELQANIESNFPHEKASIGDVRGSIERREENDETDRTHALPIVSGSHAEFQTAAGSRIQVSEAALERARIVLHGNDPDVDTASLGSDQDSHALKEEFMEDISVCPAAGFQTASGNMITISESALGKARKLLDDLDGGSVHEGGESIAIGSQLPCQANSPSNLREADNCRDVDHSEVYSVEAGSKDNEGRVPFVGFQTACGRQISISEASLEKARLFLHTDEDKTHQTLEMGGQSPKDTSQRRVSRVPEVESSISNVVKISGEALQEAFDDDVEMPMNQDQLGSVGKEGRGEVPKAVGFETASGNSIQISESSLQHAKRFLSDDLPSINPPVQDISADSGCAGITSGTKTSSGYSEDLLQLSVHGDHEGSHVPASGKDLSWQGAVGFKTARGTAVQVSETSIQRAKALLGQDGISWDHSDLQMNKSPKHDSDVRIDCVHSQQDAAIAEGQTPILKDKSQKQWDVHGEPGAPDSSHAHQQDFDVDAGCEIGDGVASRRKESMTGFQTGSGKRVTVAESSLKKVKELLSSETDDNRNILISETSVIRQADSIGSSSRSSTFPGFHTGSGKQIQISEESLKHAKTLFQLDSETSKQSSHAGEQAKREGITMGFQTGAGKSVKVSEAALQKAKVFVADSTSPEPARFQGFQTGAGKQIQISDESLEHIKTLLELDSETSKHSLNRKEQAKRGSVSMGFQTGAGRRVKVSEAALQKAKVFLADVPPPEPAGFQGFQTGAGKQIQISEQSLQQARSFLETGEEAFDSSKVPCRNDSIGFQTGKGISIKVSNAALQKATKLFDDDSYSRPSVFPGFQTGGGKQIEISDESLQQAKKFLEDNPGVSGCASMDATSSSSSDVMSGFQTGKGKKVSISAAALQQAKQVLADESPLQPLGLPGFQTGAGKQVEISEESLQKAKKFLEKDDLSADTALNEIEPPRVSVGFRTGGGKSVNISAAALETAKKFLEKDCHTAETAINEIKPAEVSLGFCTGGGKSVNISAAALQKAKKFLADDLGDGSSGEVPAAVNTAETNRLIAQLQPCEQQRTSALQSFPLPNKKLQSPGTGSGIVRREDIQNTSHASLLHQRLLLASPGTGSKENWVAREKRDLARPCSRIDGSVKTVPSVYQRTAESRGTSLTDMGRRPTEQQKKPGRGSLGTGQKPYKPPRRLEQKASLRETVLKPKQASPSSVLNDRQQLRSVHSTPPAGPGASITSNAALLQQASVFMKPGHDQNSVSQSQRESGEEATSPSQDASSSSSSSFEARWAAARKAQQQRIKSKMNEVIKPEMGSLWRMKTQQRDGRIGLREFVDFQHPSSMTDAELFGHGVLASTLGVRAGNAEEFEFAGEDHFSPSCLESREGIPLADGGRLVLNAEGLAGKREFYSALLDTPGVDPKLLKEDWVFNHYRWIVWKLAAMETAYPVQFGGRYLSPNWLLLQLKYRYDREVDHTQRPALRKLLERDEAASRRMVLCVASVRQPPPPAAARHHGKDVADSKIAQPSGHPTLELTDGWYSIPAVIDAPLAGLVRAGKIGCGTKLCLSGAEIVGSQDACCPLEIPPGLMLKITANSTRRARFDARLGLQPDPRPLPLPITSLHPEGGIVGCVDIVLLRAYPLQFMEKLPEGGTIFRNARDEAKSAALFGRQRQIRMEELYSKTQREFESKQSNMGGAGSRLRRAQPGSRSLKEVERLQSGHELYEAMEAALDPQAFQSLLTERQRSSLHDYQRSRCETRQADLQAAFKQALSAQTKEGKFERTVVPLLKLRIADYKPASRGRHLTTYLTVWRPPDDLVSQLREGKRFKISGLSVSAGRNMPGMASVQLASTRATRYQELPSASSTLQSVYTPRAAASMQWLGRGYTQAAYGELDAVGVVVSIEEPSNSRRSTGSLSGHALYLADEDGFLLAVRFWASLKALHLDDILKPGSLVAASNLQYTSGGLGCQAGGALPMATASDYTTFTLNPKAGYLQRALQNLKTQIKDVSKFVELMQGRLKTLRDATSPSVQLSPAGRYQASSSSRTPLILHGASRSSHQAGGGLARMGVAASAITRQPQTYQLMTSRSCPRNFVPAGQQQSPPVSVVRKQGAGATASPAGSADSRNAPGGAKHHPSVVIPQGSEVGGHTPMAGKQHLAFLTPEVVVPSPRVAAQQRDTARRSNLLSRIPSPPPLTPLPCPSVSALRRGFKTPLPLGQGPRGDGKVNSLRKRLRDELDEGDDQGECKSTMAVSSEEGKVELSGEDSGKLTKRQKVDCPNLNEANQTFESSSPLMLMSKTGGAKVENQTSSASMHEDLSSGKVCRSESSEGRGDIGDLLCLSVAGLQELEMSWTQSQTMSDPPQAKSPKARTVAPHETALTRSGEDGVIPEEGPLGEGSEGICATALQGTSHGEEVPADAKVQPTRQDQCLQDHDIPVMQLDHKGDHSALNQSDCNQLTGDHIEQAGIPVEGVYSSQGTHCPGCQDSKTVSVTCDLRTENELLSIQEEHDSQSQSQVLQRKLQMKPETILSSEQGASLGEAKEQETPQTSWMSAGGDALQVPPTSVVSLEAKDDPRDSINNCDAQNPENICGADAAKTESQSSTASAGGEVSNVRRSLSRRRRKKVPPPALVVVEADEEEGASQPKRSTRLRNRQKKN